ncbi:protein inturned [Chelonus insularis]|uniref:protein inturned n=1 Tax=Chelonus insularis TaxID=460826 RepID=UPI0015888F1B|nr:protein inturned [Chelonus insularis]
MDIPGPSGISGRFDVRSNVITVNTNDVREDDDSEQWWTSDSGSSSGSYYSDSDSSCSSFAEWEAEIGPGGEVFYIESFPETPGSNTKSNNNSKESESPPPELIRRRSTRAQKLMRLIRRRESKRYSTKGKKSKGADSKQVDGNTQKEGSGKEVKFQDYQAGEIKEVMLWVNPERRHNLGRRATMCEVYLGITPGNFSDKVRVMVAGFIPDSEAMMNKNIKIGDWLRSINSQDVTSENLDYILSEITSPMIVKLQLQRIAGIEVTTDAPLSNVPKQSPLVRRLVDKERSQKFMESLLDYSFGVIYLQTSGLSEAGPELQGVLYTYPRSENKNLHSILCNARGAFITLNHLLPETVNAYPISTTISVGSEKIHISYAPRNDELFLLAIPERWFSCEESIELLKNIIRSLEFTYQSLNKCFSNEDHHHDLDHLFYLTFINLLQLNPDDESSEEELSLKNVIDRREKCEFETIIGAAHQVTLPRDALIQIDTALNDLEALDEDWNDDSMDCERFFTFLGACIYHKSYLLASHLPHGDLMDVHAFLQVNGLLNLIENEPVKTMVIWKEVFPHSSNRGMENSALYDETNTKWFILVVGYETELLVAILESEGCTEVNEDDEGPDIFYVEEAQETLKHIQRVGIPTLASKWVLSNAKPETIDIKDRISVKTTIAENLLGFIKSSDNQNSTPKNTVKESGNKKVPEVTSILKKRSPEQSPIMINSVYSFQSSEDTMSQSTGINSEMSDEAAPILGRRALREKALAVTKYSDESDESEDDMYRDESQSSIADISDIRENLLTQAEYIIPMRLTTGEKNCLLYFVHLDTFEGILMSSRTVENPEKNSEIIAKFNECAHTIHKLLSNTVRYKKMVKEDEDTSAVNKNLVTIKEHGVLFEYENVTFWVIGRLFEAPYAKEFYVCYEDSAPQNLIEMAFRLQGTWL